MLTLFEARKIVDQAMRRALELGANISVAVCDNTGRLIALNQMDRSCGWETDRCSMGKAVAAAMSGLPSDRFVDHLQGQGLRAPSYSNVVPPRHQRGGLPIFESDVLRGGCGVSGAATAELDEECARAGISAIRGSTLESALVPMENDMEREGFRRHLKVAF